MAEIITQLKITLPGDLSGITERNFIRYMVWNREGREISKRLVAPFKKAVSAATGYDDDNRPEKEVKSKIRVGDNIGYVVTTTPTTKRPSYSEANDSLKGYLEVLADQYGRDIKRKDVMTINNEPYVAVGDVLERILTDINDLKEGKEGVNQKIKLAQPVSLVGEIPESVSIIFGRDCSALTDYNARIYEAAKQFMERGNEQASAFKNLILRDSLKTLGTEELDDAVALAYAFENLTFVHHIEPRETPKHKEVLYALIKEKPARFTKRSKFGDLIKAQMLMDEKGSEILEDKGLVDEDFRQTYRPVRRGETVYVRLDGLTDMIDQYANTLTKRNTEQNVFMQPGGK